jgi:hypothetical protein
LFDGETRTRTGDTTMFDKRALIPNRSRNPRSQAGLRDTRARTQSPHSALK